MTNMNTAVGIADPVSDDLAEILEGLSRPRKQLSPKFFYDQAGSELFDAICELPEYYLTRTELKIMDTFLPEMARQVGPRASVIEFGSGSGIKTRLLLEHLEQPAAYVPVDISESHLHASVKALETEFPDIEILPVVTDFSQPFPVPKPRVTSLRNLVFFPGSTIGNFEPEEALELLKVMHTEAGSHGALLIGVDLVKDTTVLESAYNDVAGVTAEFNRNMLYRLNSEFGADFRPEHFEHKAIYDLDLARIEMRLYSEERQSVSIAGRTFSFESGEYLITEHSHKYTIAGFGRLAERAGFRVEQFWTDADNLFSVHYCVRS